MDVQHRAELVIAVVALLVAALTAGGAVSVLLS